VLRVPNEVEPASAHGEDRFPVARKEASSLLEIDCIAHDQNTLHTPHVVVIAVEWETGVG
jgi:hypothetical protein